jgi:hypothetical protein
MNSRAKGWIIVAAGCFLGAAGVQAITWHWSNPVPHGNDILDMTLYNGQTVQAADSGQLYTSDDLNLWLSQNTHTTNTLLGVASLGARLIAVGANGAAIYSDDGVNFTSTNVATPNSDWLVSVAASASLAVAVGDEAIIYTSPDGAAWKQQAAPPGVGGNWLRGVTYGNGQFVAVGEGAYIATSADGTNWTRRTPPLSFSDALNWVAWVNTPLSTNGFATPAYIAAGDSGKAITSSNGITWTRLLTTASTNSLFGIAGDDDSRLLAGDNLLFLSSSPGSVANQIGVLPGAAPAWTYYTALTESNAYVVAGTEGLAVAGTEGTNGYNWFPLADASRNWMWGVTTVSNLYVAVGDQARIMTSGDGVDWTIEAMPYTNSVSPTNTVFFGVGGGTNLLIAVGSAGTTVLSTNTVVPVVTTNADGSGLSTNLVSTLGIIWNPVPPPTTNDLRGVAFFGNQYFTAGGGGTILKSADGQNWTLQTTPTTAYLSSLETYAGGLLAVGDVGTILTSPDGNTWTARTSGTTNWIFAVRNLGGRLIAVGENGTILTSTDGVNWTPRGSGTTAWLNDVQLVTNAYFIVGNQGTVLTSTNAAVWTSLGTITGNSLYGAATQNGQLIVVGIGGTILRSQLLPITTPVQILDFSQADGQNLFLVAGQTDQQFALDSSPDLLNWTPGPVLQILDSSGTLLFYLNAGTNAPSTTYYRTRLVPSP